MQDRVTIFHDPTSEPSRAVHWLVLEAELDVDVQYTWLTLGEHMSQEFLAVNPLHQVPAMRHGQFCLSEATAIMNYLTDIYGCSEKWFGSDAQSRAIVNKYCSWYHTNLRKILTLDYFLPVLLLPAYLGFNRPLLPEIEAKLDALDEMFKVLDSLLEGKSYLCGEYISAADLLYASDIFALEFDPAFSQIIAKFANIHRWLESLKVRPSYPECHKAWNHIVPQILALNGASKGSPEWIAFECKKVV